MELTSYNISTGKLKNEKLQSVSLGINIDTFPKGNGYLLHNQEYKVRYSVDYDASGMVRADSKYRQSKTKIPKTIAVIKVPYNLVNRKVNNTGK